MALSIFALPDGISQKQEFRREWNWRTWTWKKCAMPQLVPTKAHNLKRKWDWQAWTWTASVGRLAPSIHANSEEKRKIVTWNWKTWMWSNCFPLLSLPDEIISQIFSFLPIKDRMRARLNKRLDKIELESKYFMKKLSICQVSINSRIPISLHTAERCIIFYKEKSYSSDCIKRILNNTTVGYLDVQLSGSKRFHRDVFNMIPSYTYRSICIQTNDCNVFSIMNDEYFLNLARSTDYLYLSNNMIEFISPQSLHEVYKMLSDSSGISYLEVEMKLNQYISFFNLIGITNQDGNFFSSREGIELFTLPLTNRFDCHIFDGNVQMIFHWKIIEMWIVMATLDEEDDYDRFDDSGYPVIFRRYSTKESIEIAKNSNGFEKFDDFFSPN